MLFAGSVAISANGSGLGDVFCPCRKHQVTDKPHRAKNIAKPLVMGSSIE